MEIVSAEPSVDEIGGGGLFRLLVFNDFSGADDLCDVFSPDFLFHHVLLGASSPSSATSLGGQSDFI